MLGNRGKAKGHYLGEIISIGRVLVSCTTKYGN